MLDTLERMQLTEFKDRHIAALSGRLFQRVLLARAIVSKPDVVILDEPNTYIDRRFQKQMYEMLEQINKGVRHHHRQSRCSRSAQQREAYRLCKPAPALSRYDRYA